MLHITIKDTESNEVIYDEEVSMVIMQAAEKDNIRSIRHTTKAASLTDVMNCVHMARSAAVNSTDLLVKAFKEAFDEIDSDDE